MVTNVVLGDAIKLATGASALYGSVPLVTLIGAMNGASVGMLGLVTERTNGLLARLWVVPVTELRGLLARIISDAVRIVLNSFALLCVGLILGLQLKQGWLAGVAWLCIPVLFGMAFATLALTVAVYWSNPDSGRGDNARIGPFVVLLHRFRAVESVSEVDPAGCRTSTVVVCNRSDARADAWRPGSGPADRDSAVVRRHCRRVCDSDGDRLSTRQHAWLSTHGPSANRTTRRLDSVFHLGHSQAGSQ